MRAAACPTAAATTPATSLPTPGQHALKPGLSCSRSCWVIDQKHLVAILCSSGMESGQDC